MEEHKKQVVFATWLGIVVNVLLTILKGVVGFISGSKALLADAAHSASDIVGSVIVLFGIRIAMKPADKEHPYGHGKAENIASIIVALILIVVGVEIAITSAKVFFGEPPIVPGKIALIAIVISLVVKEVLFQYKYRLGKKINSVALISEAWHHRSDALSSGAALVGVGATMIGAHFDLSYLIYSDAVAGIVVSFIVIKVGYSLAKDSSMVMMEQVLPKEEANKFKKTVLQVDGVLKVDQILARTHGHYVIIDIKIGVDSLLSVEEGHSIGKDVKKSLIDSHKEVKDVLVHINPYDEDEE